MDLTSMTSKEGETEQAGSVSMWKKGPEIWFQNDEKEHEFLHAQVEKQTAYNHTDVQDDLEQTFL